MLPSPMARAPTVSSEPTITPSSTALQTCTATRATSLAYVFFLSFFLGGILQMVFWPFTASYASVITFGAAYGLTGGVFMTLVPPVCAKVFGMENLATITGLMVGGVDVCARLWD